MRGFILACLALFVSLTMLAQNDLYNTTWLLDKINAVKYRPASGATLIMGQDASISGNTGCNNYRANCKIASNKISIQPIISTRRACVDFQMSKTEADFMKFLAKATSYKINKNTLVFYQNKTPLLQFVAQAKDVTTEAVRDVSRTDEAIVQESMPTTADQLTMRQKMIDQGIVGADEAAQVQDLINTKVYNDLKEALREGYVDKGSGEQSKDGEFDRIKNYNWYLNGIYGENNIAYSGTYSFSVPSNSKRFIMNINCNLMLCEYEVFGPNITIKELNHSQKNCTEGDDLTEIAGILAMVAQWEMQGDRLLLKRDGQVLLAFNFR